MFLLFFFFADVNGSCDAEEVRIFSEASGRCVLYAVQMKLAAF